MLLTKTSAAAGPAIPMITTNMAIAVISLAVHPALLGGRRPPLPNPSAPAVRCVSLAARAAPFGHSCFHVVSSVLPLVASTSGACSFAPRGSFPLSRPCGRARFRALCCSPSCFWFPPRSAPVDAPLVVASVFDGLVLRPRVVSFVRWADCSLIPLSLRRFAPWDPRWVFCSHRAGCRSSSRFVPGRIALWLGAGPSPGTLVPGVSLWMLVP